MKNQIIAKVMGNEFLRKVVGEVGSFYISHQSLILTTGTIGFSLATVAATYKNAAKIEDCLQQARFAIANCNTKEEKNQVYGLMLKELTGLVLPIIIFEAATIGCAVMSKKHSDRLETRLAETAGALTIAQSAIAQYQSFTKEAEKELGTEKVQQINAEVAKENVVDGRRFTAIASEGAPGEELIIDKYSGRPFWASFTNVENAVEKLGMRLGVDGGFERQTVSDLYDILGNKDLTPNELSDRFGYVEGEKPYVYFTDTHYIFPNGTRVQAAVMNLCPEPECI